MNNNVKTIATLNCRGLNQLKIRIIRKILLDHKIDVLCLQETHRKTDEFTREAEKFLQSEIVTCDGTTLARGCWIVIRPESEIKVQNIVWKEENGNCLILKIEINDEKYNLVNVYGPRSNVERGNLSAAINNRLYSHRQEPTIYAGDHNYVPNTDLDRNPPNKRKELNNATETLIRDHDMVDVFRELHPNSIRYTYRGAGIIASRLDRIYVNQQMTIYQRITDDAVVPIAFSDHELYFIRIKQDQPRNKSNERKQARLWIYNNQILNNEIYMKDFEEMWKEWLTKKEQYVDPMLYWEHSKTKIASFLKKKGKENKQVKEQKRKRLERELEKLAEENKDATNDRIREVKAEITQMEKEKSEGEKIRAKVTWKTEGERPTRYFFQLEKQQQQKRTISAIKDENGVSHSDHGKIKEVIVNYYKELFRKRDTNDNCEQKVLNNIKTRVKEEDIEDMIKPMTIKEVHQVIKELANNKSPGSDGLTAEFYKQTFYLIGPLLTETFNNIYFNGIMPKSMNEGILSLIFKEKGDIESLRNWRGITLLNLDYKILTRTFNKRICKPLSYIIHTDQACAVKGRSISDQLIILEELLHYVKDKEDAAMLVGLDLERAYDVVEHGYLFKAIRKFGYPEPIVNFIKTIYKNMNSRIKVNGDLTEPFGLSRSIRQGDPASTGLFILAIEPLAEMLRSNPKMHPILLPNSGPRGCVQFADDTTVISSKAGDFKTIMETVETFERGAGAKLNKSKTEVLLFGNITKLGDTSMIPQENLKNCIKLLGMYFGEEAEEKNCQVLMKKIEEDLKKWSVPYLTLQGKNLIISSLVVPKFLYPCRARPFSQQFIKKLEKVVSDFIWGPGKIVKISLKVLQNEITDGGIGLANFKLQQDAALLERLRKVTINPKIPWSGLMAYRLGFSLRDVHDFFKLAKVRQLKQSPTSAYIQTLYNEHKHNVNKWDTMDFGRLKRLLYIKSGIKYLPRRDFSETWNAIQNSDKTRKRRDLNYLIAMKRIFIGELFGRWNPNRIGEHHCKICGKKRALETTEHLFVECEWTLPLRNVIMTSLGFVRISEEEILYHQGQVKTPVQNLVLGLYKETILKIRNKKCNGELKTRQETVQAIEKTFNYKLKYHIRNSDI